MASCCHVERSLQRLRIDPIDLLQIHSMNGTDELMPLLQQWKRPGRMRRYPIDLVQVDYSIGNRGVEREIFLVALERKVAVMANVPLGRATLLQRLVPRSPAGCGDAGADGKSPHHLDISSVRTVQFAHANPADSCNQRGRGGAPAVALVIG